MTERRSKRWLRLVVPPGIVLLLVLVGLVGYVWEQPDEGDAAYLSPTDTSGIGGRTLADAVRAAGVTIVQVRDTSAALGAFGARNLGDVTLLLTTPQFVHPTNLKLLALLPASTQVVLVEPNRQTLLRGRLPIARTERALASSARAPGCGYRPAAAAGRAGVHRTRYGPVDPADERELARCYDDSVVVFSRGSTTMTVVGSADPFRNDRIGEEGNAKLAVGLLTTRPRLVWVDLHHFEAPIKLDPGNGPGTAPASSPVTPEPAQSSAPNGGAPGDPPNPLWHAFPPWTYVSAALLLLMFLLYALARSRRMGGPVAEPLPVVVRSSETVIGRGRLYQRAGARQETLGILRSAAVDRMARLLRLDPDGDRGTLVAAVAGWTGWPPAGVEDTLFGPPPGDDDSMVSAAVRLDALLEAITTAQPDAAEGARR